MSIGLGIGLSLRSQLVGGAFDPATLFASGEEGAWYEPSTTTAFLSTTDLTLCAVGDTCGFLLDKSKGAGYSGGSFTVLGSELVTNGDGTSTAGWNETSSTLSASGGEFTITRAADFPGQYPTIDRALTTEANKTYYASFIYKGGTATVASIQAGTTSRGGDLGSSGVDKPVPSVGEKIDFVFTATGTTTYITVVGGREAEGGENNTVILDDISVKELPGNHATQATVAARPILRQTGGGLYYLEFDGVDDGLITPSINWGGSRQMDVFAGIRSLDTAGNLNRWFENVDTLNQRITCDAPQSGTNHFQTAIVRDAIGGAVASVSATASEFAPPIDAVFASQHDMSDTSAILRIDGAEIGSDVTGGDAGALPTSPMTIGYTAFSSLFAEVNLYGLIVRGASSTSGEISDTEAYLAAKSGVTL